MTDDTLFGTIKNFLFVTIKSLENRMTSGFASVEYNIHESNKMLEQRLEEKLVKKIESAKQELSKKIETSQADTNEALSALVHEGYNMHEERIQRIEKELNFIP